jgi:lysophospholipase L1-like esterase
MGLLQGEYQIRHASELYVGVATSLDVPEKHILEAFRPSGLAVRLDQHNPAVQEGMRVTFELLKEMKHLCDEQQVRFMVVVIPTKEQVFSEYLEHNPRLPLNNVIDDLIANERVARAKTFESLAQAGISYVDPLLALKESVTSGLYARTAADMHPNKNGHKVIAEAVYRELHHDQAEK